MFYSKPWVRDVPWVLSNDAFAVAAIRQKERCDKLSVDLNELIPVKKIREPQVEGRVPLVKESRRAEEVECSA